MTTPCHAQCNQVEILREEVRRLRAIVATDPQLTGESTAMQVLLREAIEHADGVLAATAPPKKAGIPSRLSSAERAACAAWANASGLEEELVQRALQRLALVIQSDHSQIATLRLTTRNPIQAVIALADAVASTFSITQRVMIATMAFGVTGPEILSLLTLGAERLEALALTSAAAC